eukprot:TRINITY_DN5126_c0_g3_i1.p3 TRINITY_DN5126_c0_g3~~TRINITY_DN5126_c0_g3_i1.p3  ORF type:complete len:215 (+),score=3.27 TRINITY_DN5126_c0_g3_i1:104-748(+)
MLSQLPRRCIILCYIILYYIILANCTLCTCQQLLQYQSQFVTQGPPAISFFNNVLNIKLIIMLCYEYFFVNAFLANKLIFQSMVSFLAATRKLQSQLLLGPTLVLDFCGHSVVVVKVLKLQQNCINIMAECQEQRLIINLVEFFAVISLTVKQKTGADTNDLFRCQVFFKIIFGQLPRSYYFLKQQIKQILNIKQNNIIPMFNDSIKYNAWQMH